MKNVNRSAALVRLGKDELALQDIELAVEAGYPKELRFSSRDLGCGDVDVVQVQADGEESEDRGEIAQPGWLP